MNCSSFEQDKFQNRQLLVDDLLKCGYKNLACVAYTTENPKMFQELIRVVLSYAHYDLTRDKVEGVKCHLYGINQ